MTLRTAFCLALLLARRVEGQQVVADLARAGGEGESLVAQGHGLLAADHPVHLMISQAALCLLRDGLETKGGIWTPGAAMGETLVKRMQDTGVLTFEAKV